MYKSCRLFPWNEYHLAKETPQEIIFNIVVCFKKKKILRALILELFLKHSYIQYKKTSSFYSYFKTTPAFRTTTTKVVYSL